MTNSKELKARMKQTDFVWLSYLVRGYTSQEIADEMKLPKYSIDQNIYLMMLRMGCTKRTQAVAIAVKHRLVTDDYRFSVPGKFGKEKVL